MKTLCVFLTVLSMVTMMACSTINVIYDYDKQADFSSLKTYSWLPPRPGTPDAELVIKRVVYEVNAQLEAKGFEMVAEDPDFLIALKKSRENKVHLRRGNKNRYRYDGSNLYRYEQATIVLDIVDAKKDELIWQGSATGETDPSPTPEKRDKNVSKAVTSILENFPPTP